MKSVKLSKKMVATVRAVQNAHLKPSACARNFLNKNQGIVTVVCM